MADQAVSRAPWRADLAAYRAVLRSRMRAQTAYRGSFALDMVTSLLVSVTELAEVWIIFHNVSALGGLDFRAMLLVFGLAEATFAFADLVVGHIDQLPTYLRAGTLEMFYVRPLPLLAQLVTSDITLRRLARVGVGVAAFVAGVLLNDVHWSVSAVAMIVLAVLSGVVIFGAMFVCAAGLQFFLVDGYEATNAFVYGGRFAGTQPAAVWSLGLKLVFGFVFPVAFVGYLPSLQLLDLPGGGPLPAWLGWCTPLAAVWMCLFAGFWWRLGVRHYQGGGG